jgi:putative transposase
MKYKKWSFQEKLEILASSDELGMVETCRKYSLSTGTLYSWKKKHESQGEAGLKVTYDIRSKELKQSMEENRILRKLLSNKEIELEVQRELLKKKFGTSDPRKI